MRIERQFLSYIAILIATVYYFFGRAEAAAPELPTVSEQPCPQTSMPAGKMFACKPGQSSR